MTITEDNLQKHTILPFSSLDDIKAIVDVLAGELAEVSKNNSTHDTRLADLQSRLLKSEVKHTNLV